MQVIEVGIWTSNDKWNRGLFFVTCRCRTGKKVRRRTLQRWQPTSSLPENFGKRGTGGKLSCGDKLRRDQGLGRVRWCQKCATLLGCPVFLGLIHPSSLFSWGESAPPASQWTSRLGYVCWSICYGAWGRETDCFWGLRPLKTNGRNPSLFKITVARAQFARCSEGPCMRSRAFKMPSGIQQSLQCPIGIILAQL